MKIKTVCEKTGLTDRTVRYYIEEGLINPQFTENYLGRKAFDFTDENISELNDIAILRSFDFSIEEIRGILKDPTSSPAIIKDAKERLAKNLLINQKKVSAMSALDEELQYTVADLARELSKPEEMAVSQENVAPNLSKRILAGLRGTAMFMAVWLPILISLTIGIVKIISYKNPIFHPVLLGIIVFCFVPSVVSMFTSKIKLLQKQKVKKVLIGICILCIPICTASSVFAITDCQHSWSELAVEREVSCSAEGRIIRKCNDCRAVEVVTVPKLPHKEVTDYAIEASCAEEGLTEGKHCTVCNEATIPQMVIEKKPHSYTRTVTKGDCSNRGYTYFECVGCKESYTSNIIPPTEQHSFVKNGDLGYKCTVCDLKVCEYGNADGSYMGGVYCPVQYYITGVIDPNNEVERTLVIHGYGKMPEATGEYKAHPWLRSVYTEELRSIVICEGVVSISTGAFSENLDDDIWNGNPFRSVKSFVIKNKNLKIDRSSPNISGIKCEITYSK